MSSNQKPLKKSPLQNYKTYAALTSHKEEGACNTVAEARNLVRKSNLLCQGFASFYKCQILHYFVIANDKDWKITAFFFSPEWSNK